jgi:hypothetical protein
LCSGRGQGQRTTASPQRAATTARDVTDAMLTANRETKSHAALQVICGRPDDGPLWVRSSLSGRVGPTRLSNIADVRDLALRADPALVLPSAPAAAASDVSTPITSERRPAIRLVPALAVIGGHGGDSSSSSPFHRIASSFSCLRHNWEFATNRACDDSPRLFWCSAPRRGAAAVPAAGGEGRFASGECAVQRSWPDSGLGVCVVCRRGLLGIEGFAVRVHFDLDRRT